jgi:ABC-type nitrate/sulfonate/bicarbonate transport system permease component
MTQNTLSTRSRRRQQTGLLLRLLSVLSLFLAWIIGNRIFGATVLPGTADSLAFIVREYERGALLLHVGGTM